MTNGVLRSGSSGVLTFAIVWFGQLKSLLGRAKTPDLGTLHRGPRNVAEKGDENGRCHWMILIRHERLQSVRLAAGDRRTYPNIWIEPEYMEVE